MPHPSLLTTDVLSWLSCGSGPELHWFPEDVSASRLAVTLVGMANTIGGRVLLGVSPRGVEVHGVRDVQEALDRVFQAELLAEPTLVLPIPQLATVNGVQVVVITVPPGLSNVYNVDGRYWGREGKQTTLLSARRLRALLVERGVIQFESRLPPQATLNDLDLVQVKKYLDVLDFPGIELQDLEPNDLSWQELLIRRGSVKRSEGQFVPTYAALLMFGRVPQQWLPSATILAARFPGTSFSDEFVSQEINGTLPEQLVKAEAFLRVNLRNTVRMVGLSHTETLEYPFEAVRELLVNAVAHRDYNAQGDMIHLHIFSDRLEVHSPGGLPGPVNLENLLEARFARNAVITQLLSDLGYVERLGYGLDRVVSAMHQHGLREPRFEEVAGTFRVTLYNDLDKNLASLDAPGMVAYQNQGLNSRQLQALRFLAHQPRINNHDYQKLSPDVHMETLRRDFADLVSRGILIKVGDKRATYYILKKKPTQEEA